MTFYSPEFIFIFLPSVVALYALAGKKLRGAVLFLGSVVFYLLASRDLMSMAILASSLLFNYAAGLFIGIAEGRMRKLLFGFCTLVNAAALLSPKIISIITESFGSFLPEGLAIAAPVGFSFYMFKNMSAPGIRRQDQSRAILFCAWRISCQLCTGAQRTDSDLCRLEKEP